MSDRFYAEISIGGTLNLKDARSEDVSLFVESLNDVWHTDCSSRPNATIDNLADIVDESGFIEVCDPEARNGEFDDLETACHNLGLSFNRKSEAAYEYPQELVVHRPDGMKRNFILVDGQRTLTESDANMIKKLAKDELYQRVIEYIEAALPPLPELPEFKVVK